MSKIDKLIQNKRKLVMAVLAAGVGVGVDVGTQTGLSQNLMTLLLGLSGSFTVGNAVEHVAKRKKEKNVGEDLQAITARLESLKDDSINVKQKLDSVETVKKELQELNLKSDQALESVALGNQGIGEIITGLRGAPRAK